MEDQSNQIAPEEVAQQPSQKTSLLSPEGILMMSVGMMLDFLSIVCAVLILAAGVGLLLSKIVYVVGFIIVNIWSIFRGGGIQRGKGKMSKQTSKGMGGFLKKYGKNLAVKIIPAIGDIAPLWTFTIYTELKS
ncbi:MAG: hypothetical protein ACKKMW_00665 [Candidatus Nealsonbacteria bacterium]